MTDEDALGREKGGENGEKSDGWAMKGEKRGAEGKHQHTEQKQDTRLTKGEIKSTDR